MLTDFEVRVGEKEEESLEGRLVEVVGEELHCVGADDGDILVRPWGMSLGTRSSSDCRCRLGLW